MKERETYPGKTYAVTSANGCTIYRADGVTTLKVATAGQDYFVAAERKVYCSDAAALVTECFNSAPTSASGGGVSITVDQTYKPSSENPASGKAVNAAFNSNGIYNSTSRIAMGYTVSVLQNTQGVGIGFNVQATNRGVSLGCDNKAGKSAVAVGDSAQSSAVNSAALGYKARNADAGTVLIAANDGAGANNANSFTYLYLIGAGSPLAMSYEGGEACLGYVVKDASGNVSACGTRKLSELLTNNTAFAPAALDLDAPAPTPFLPTGIWDDLTAPVPQVENSIIS